MSLNQFKISSSTSKKPALSSSKSGGTPSAMSMLSMINSNQQTDKRLAAQSQPKRPTPLKESFTAPESQAIGNYGSVRQHIDYLNQKMADPETFKSAFIKANIPLPGGIATAGDENAQGIKFALDDMSDRILRMRSGAAINEKEYQRLRSFMPNIIDITSAKNGDFGMVKRKLALFNNEFEQANNRALYGRTATISGMEQPGMLQGNPQTQSPQQSGSSNEDQYIALRRSGVPMQEAKRRLGL